MGLTFLARFALAITAIAPVGLIFAIVDYWQGDLGTMWIALLSTLLMATICMAVLRKIHSPRARSPQAYPITTVEPVDRDNTAIILLYFMPVLTADFEGFNLVVWGPTLLVFLIVALTGHGCFFNPLLGLFGWHFYRVGTPENVIRLLISRKTLRKGNRTIIGVELGDYVIMEVK